MSNTERYVQQSREWVSRGKRIEQGEFVAARELVAVRSERVMIPDPARTVHLQFRRFAGCPVCNLHLQSIVHRHHAIAALGLREIVVFHSTAEALLPFVRDFPFAVIADPDKRLYRAFGVESSPQALLHPRAWLPILRGVIRSLGMTIIGRQPLPSVQPQGGRLGLPADFLIASDGRVLACKYGAHVYDQWTVEELLDLASRSDPTFSPAI
jgi:peroxiredoxin